MARPEILIPGNCYFSVGYYDNDLVLPMIDTLVYVGEENDQSEGRLWLFKQPESPTTPDEKDAAPEPQTLIGFSDKQLPEILDFNGLMQKLSEVAADHPRKPIPLAGKESATPEDFESIPGEVVRFLNDQECVGLTMMVRFTDDGLSLGRREGEYDMSFFTHPRRDLDEETRITSAIAVGRACSSFRSRASSIRLPDFAGACFRRCTRCAAAMCSTITS